MKLKRSDIVQHLSDLNIKPSSKVFKNKFLEYFCDKTHIELGEVSENIKQDINTIIRQFKKYKKSDVKFMFKKHPGFYGTVIKIKRVQPPVTSPTVISKFFKSHL